LRPIGRSRRIVLEGDGGEETKETGSHLGGDEFDDPLRWDKLVEESIDDLGAEFPVFGKGDGKTGGKDACEFGFDEFRFLDVEVESDIRQTLFVAQEASNRDDERSRVLDERSKVGISKEWEWEFED